MALHHDHNLDKAGRARSLTPFSSSPLSAPRYRRFHPRGPMAEKGNGPSAHPSHKLAYLFSASHGHEHPATIQWSLLDASGQVHNYFACCRAWGFHRSLGVVWKQVSTSLACDSFSCGEGRYCPLSLPSGLSEGTVIAPRSTSTSAAHPNPLHPAEADSMMVGHVVLARNQGQSLFSRANKSRLDHTRWCHAKPAKEPTDKTSLGERQHLSP
jgi:hypothetical protein